MTSYYKSQPHVNDVVNIKKQEISIINSNKKSPIIATVYSSSKACKIAEVDAIAAVSVRSIRLPNVIA
jgi:hypothetical protein